MKPGDWVELAHLDRNDVAWEYVEANVAYRVTQVAPNGELFVDVPGDHQPHKAWAVGVWKRTNHPLTELFKKHYESR
jgi:hypothetical protein